MDADDETKMIVEDEDPEDQSKENDIQPIYPVLIFSMRVTLIGPKFIDFG